MKKFDVLKYQIYDALAAHMGKVPEDDDLYLDLETVGDAEIYLYCEDPSRIEGELIGKLEKLLSAGRRELSWSIGVSKQPGDPLAFSITADSLAPKD